MEKLWAIVLLHLWTAVMIYAWFINRNGNVDRQNYERYQKSFWRRWMLAGRDRETFLRQHRHLHRLALPFVFCFYSLMLYDILFTH